MGRRSDLTVDERSEIVLALLRREEPLSVLARRHGGRRGRFGCGRDDFTPAGPRGLGSGQRQPPGRRDRLGRLESGVAERDRVIGELTIANRILKKNGLPRA